LNSVALSRRQPLSRYRRNLLSLASPERTPEEVQERRAALREALPGLLFCVFVLVVSLGAIVWLFIASLSGGAS
jgi:hypothetical protein